jgi:hypothetical protein
MNLILTDSGLTAMPTIRSQVDTMSINMANNPMSAISKEALALPSLFSLVLTGTDFTSYPCISASPLTSLTLDQTPMTEIPCLSPKVSVLSMDNSYLRKVLPRHATSMQGISSLYLRNMPELEEIHDYMDLGRSNRLAITNTPSLDLCRCAHVWLKIAVERGASVQVTDAACEGGGMWTALNSSRLLELCDASAFQGKKYNKHDP